MSSKVLFAKTKKENSKADGKVDSKVDETLRNAKYDEDDGSKHRSWLFTLHNYSPEYYNWLCEVFKEQAKYYIIGREVGLCEVCLYDRGYQKHGFIRGKLLCRELTGGRCGKTIHLQGYVTWKEARAFSTLKNKYGGPIRWAYKGKKATTYDNYRYCKKEGLYVEWGKRPQQGKADMKDIKERLLEGEITANDVAVDAWKIHRVYWRELEAMEERGREMKFKPRNFKTKGYWLMGEAGTYKTFMATKMFEGSCYIYKRTGNFWDKYNGEDNVIIDDFRGDEIEYNELLKMIDWYPYTVATKYRARNTQFISKRVIITCPKSPWKVYEQKKMIMKSRRVMTPGMFYDDDMEQLARRINVYRACIYNENGEQKVKFQIISKAREDPEKIPEITIQDESEYDPDAYYPEKDVAMIRYELLTEMSRNLILNEGEYVGENGYKVNGGQPAGVYTPIEKIVEDVNNREKQEKKKELNVEELARSITHDELTRLISKYKEHNIETTQNQIQQNN